MVAQAAGLRFLLPARHQGSEWPLHQWLTSPAVRTGGNKCVTCAGDFERQLTKWCIRHVV